MAKHQPDEDEVEDPCLKREPGAVGADHLPGGCLSQQLLVDVDAEGGAAELGSPTLRRAARSRVQTAAACRRKRSVSLSTAAVPAAR